jgi:hypothetical protein
VSLLLSVAADAPGSISGIVNDAKSPPQPIAGVAVSVEGGAAGALTGSDGRFTLTGVPPGPVFLGAAAPSAGYLDGETRSAVFVGAGANTSGVTVVLSARP